ncbi:hypothetical protein KF707_00455 [Candidatus Obscuribacterales bacterium]|nr:hypothetical protein [Candidatus Obscuribacterales bacterium]
MALAFGVASGLRAIAGLYGAIACGIIAAIFGGTRYGFRSREEHKRVNEARGFAGRSPHGVEILIMLVITPNELKFALETSQFH